MKILPYVTSALMLLFLIPATPLSARADDEDHYGSRQDGFYVAQERGRSDRRTEHRDRRERSDRGDRNIRRGDDHDRRPGYILDRRYHHDRYYPPRGHIERALPRGYLTLRHHGDRYFYRDGIWYRSSGLGFIVVMPPFGIVVPVLPPYYTTIWVGGIPYYYADNVYYVWRPAMQGYVVTEPPANNANVVPQTPDSEQFYVYPRNGQSREQQEKDRYECHRWAVSQTGFDPSQPGSNLTSSQLTEKRADYRRAITACLDARGYSVK